MVKAKVFLYAKHFEGPVTPSNFRLIEEEVSPILKDGEYLVEALYISVDTFTVNIGADIGKPVIGSQVGRIIKSRNPKFPVGKLVVGYYGWRTLTIAREDTKGHEVFTPPLVLPDLGNLSPSLSLGVIGMTGNTAYFAMLHVLKPKAGETLVVSGAAGAVGSVAGQIGKIKGLKVIGIAGADDKGKWLTDELGFDHFINYKKENVSQRLKELAPEGVDCYFDNVCGPVSQGVFEHLKLRGRVVIVGAIAYHTDMKNHKRDLSESEIFTKAWSIYGFHGRYWEHRWMEGIEQNLKWVQEGKMKYKETETVGFENTPKAFMEMLNGGNTGKAVVKV